MTKGTAPVDPHVSIVIEPEQDDPFRITRSTSLPGGYSGFDTESDPGAESDEESVVTAPDSPSDDGSFEVPKTPEDDNMSLPTTEGSTVIPEYTVRFEEHFGALPAEWNGFNPDDYEYAYSW